MAVASFDNMENRKLTPMLKQFMEIKTQHPDKIILFRMGDFYETFFDDASETSKILGITLTARDKKADNPIPLAGFPYHALENYLGKLVKAGRKIVICEQLENPKNANGLVKRGIVDIITPGSIIEGKFISKNDHNFLVAICEVENKIGFSAIDVSTGDFTTTELKTSQIYSEIERLKPAEIIVQNEEIKKKLLKFKLNYALNITIFDSWFFEPKEAIQTLKKHFGTTTLEGFGTKNKKAATTAAGVALSYIKSLKNSELNHIINLQVYSLENFLQLDEISRRNLELTKSIRYGTNFGTLISILDNTKTPMGSRKIQDWMLNPLLDVHQIEERLNAVTELIEHYHLTSDLRNIFSSVGDLSRILSKNGSLRTTPRDAIALYSYLQTAPQISEILQKFETKLLQNLAENIENYDDILALIDSSIQEEPPLQITDGNIIKIGFNQDLDELREVSKSGKSWIAKLEQSEREKTGINSLKVNYNKVFGYYIEITKAHKNEVPEYYIRKQTLVNAERYISPELKEYEAKVLGAEERIKNLEYELFLEIRQKLFEKVQTMQAFVSVLSSIDVLTNLAFIAHKRNYIRPKFNDENFVEIKSCRHPVIEKLLENEEFIPNDVKMDQQNLISLITGPNMAGKSTYLRQIGLLVIMAQMGSFVPAEKANLQIFDKVFTRVGASDNLAMGQSTFLVEMIETANILNSATPKSLILLDEIGRGTSTFDGLSLAWSIVEFIHNNPKISAKTLFATHYHELTELENILPKVKNYNVVVKEWNDKIIFLRKIERGSADQSYGIQVARLAGVPQKVISRAKEILANLEEHELSPQGLTAKAKKKFIKPSNQMDIFDAIFEKTDEKNKILDEIKNLDLNNLTPLQTLNYLAELKKRL